uniref:Uncharacterized protein n=1 Tax=Paramormyrops kingsleyae TaxID=1676925 RepID=A0A3B3S2S5_9TELE
SFLLHFDGLVSCLHTIVLSCVFCTCGFPVCVPSYFWPLLMFQPQKSHCQLITQLLLNSRLLEWCIKIPLEKGWQEATGWESLEKMTIKIFSCGRTNQKDHKVLCKVNYTRIKY